MGMIRSLFSLALLAVFIFVGLTVPIGERTLFGHVSNIWASDEAQELVDGVKESSGPLVDRVKRGVQAGLEEEGEEQLVDALKTEDTQRTDSSIESDAKPTESRVHL